MATTITFTDTIGAATLKNGKPTPADRFIQWTPKTMPYGSTATRQSDRVPTFFELGVMYTASFQLTMIPARTVSGTRLVDIADRFVAHLIRGGSCTVNTGDSASNSYSNCYLVPGTEPTLVLADERMLEYTLSVALFNASTRMSCFYDS